MHTFPCIVVVSSSDGGIQAFVEIICHIPDTIAASIIWLHQLAEKESLPVIAGYTSLPVTYLTRDHAIQPGHIYIASGSDIIQLTGNQILILPPAESPVIQNKVDYFLESVAKSAGDKAIAVILSGTTREGAKGIQAISDTNGKVLVQTPKTAQADALPKHSIQTDCVDYVLPLSEIARYLVNLAKPAEKNSKIRNEWQTLLENTPDIIARYNKNLAMQFISSAVESDFGIKPGELTGLQPSQYKIVSTDPHGLTNKIREVFQTGIKLEHISEYTLPQGKRYYHSVLMPEFGENNEVRSVLVMGRNITQLKNTEADLLHSQTLLKEKNEQLIKVNEHLENFVYTVAHDLRAPVANLKMLTSLLAKQHTDDKGKIYLDNIEHSVDRLENTITDLVQILEIQSTYKIIVHRIPFQEILDEIRVELSEFIPKTNCIIESDFTACPEIRYIRPYLVSIFKNMISNAIKYQDEKRPLLISITSSRVQDFVQLTFQDNGLGINISKLGHKLFKPFVRLTTKGQGKGIGLYLLKNMIDRNGGRIEITSELNKGTLFTCYLKEYSQPDTSL